MNKELQKELLRIKEIAHMISVSTSTINRWISNGKFPKPYKLSSNISVWRYEEVQQWIDDNLITAA